MTFAEFEAFFRAFDEQELWKFRLTYHGGREFVDHYCIKFSGRENDTEFQRRKQMTYNPSYASGAIQEVRNSIFERMSDITRTGGPRNYQRAMIGLDNGVDLIGTNMNHFMGVRALEELLVGAEFGIYVDKPPLEGDTLADNVDSPYVYLYCREDILAYEYDIGYNPNEFKTLLVRDYENRYDQALGLSIQRQERFKLFNIKIINGQRRVVVQMIDKPEIAVGIQSLNILGNPEMIFGEEQILDIDRIPFVMERIPKSFMTDIADAQIALMNLASADIWYLLRANFPFYIEPWDPKSEAGHIKRPESTIEPQHGANSIHVGPTSGRRYPMGTNQPAFISPPTDPIKASMLKQDQIKNDIRAMVQLSLTSLTSSADSKNADKEKLEDGLAYLATILQHAENKVAEYWAMYEAAKPAVVQYPTCYSSISETDERENIKLLMDTATKTTSQTLRKACLKLVARKLVGYRINPAEYDKIISEINSNKVVLADWQEIAKDIENGLVSNDTASQARGYPAGETQAAAQDHANRLIRIQNAQTPATDPGARGLKDQQQDPNAGKQEKQQSRDTTTLSTPTDNTRGPGVKLSSN